MDAKPLLAAALAIGLSGCGGASTNESDRTTDQQVQLVTLESANSPGTSPWMESVASPDIPTAVPRIETASATRTVSGDQIGLYGGSANLVVCDRDKMVGFLEQNPPLAAAWRSVTGATDVRGYASGLSPLLLTRDVRVTNHGFKNGEPTAFQSVLQTGTAVLVDNRGLPRVRCDSGSPLSEPQGDMGDEEFTGTGWQSLDADLVVAVEQSETPLDNFEVVDAGDAQAPPPASQTVAVPTTSAAPVPRMLSYDIGDIEGIPDPDITLPPDFTVVTVAVEPPVTTETTTATTPVTTSGSPVTTTTPIPTTTAEPTETGTATGEPHITETPAPIDTPTTVVLPQGELPTLP